MAKPAFSDRGDAPTEYERTLITNGADEPRHMRELWLTIAQRIGADAFAVVLDELGGLPNLSVPSRQTFFRDLYRAQRNAQIVAMAGTLGPCAIAREMGVHPRTVDRALRASRVTRTPIAGNRPSSWSKRSRGSHTR